MTSHVSSMKNNGNLKIHRAGWIIIDAHTIIDNGYIEVENGKINGVYKGRPKQKYFDHGPGVLMPPLVNAHLHLELSALKNMVPFNKKFRSWVQSLLEKRSALKEIDLIAAARKEARTLVQQGNLYIADISTLGIGQAILNGININGILFNEYLGSDTSLLFTQKTDTLSTSLAGHAPHSTSPSLLQWLKKESYAAQLPFSIHVAESDDETQFINDKKGSWADFLASRRIDFSSWDIGNKTPVAYIHKLGILGPSTLAVHMLNVSDKDIQIIANTKTKVCLCPRSNFNLHDKLPDIDALLKHSIAPALGTDSLASCDTLNILDEMEFIKKRYPNISDETLFCMGTLNGAKALGLDHLTGTLSQGKKAHFIYRSTNATNKKHLIERIVTNE
ncbi:MAG: amidohydrolase family protein [Desulfobacula sp.]|nr:amidohydrolase family protein [Desulfobacula sp.]